MKVRDLIAALQECPPDAEVTLSGVMAALAMAEEEALPLRSCFYPGCDHPCPEHCDKVALLRE